ncbi:TadE/TadG family type IV pilus assembly protein [Salinarimonas chemoclinalis]|uniref:TadE/TadG family type IV pilus assembly protein n=1 Tax=Salinarimonas chemoclinalis TaxID=3241599 RepID=UPI0035564054
MRTIFRPDRIARLRARFTADSNGAVAVALGLVLVPLIGIVGVAVDYSQLGADRSALQRAADAAALAAASADDAADLDALAEEVVMANLRADGRFRVTDVDHSETGGMHAVYVGAERDGAFSGFLGGARGVDVTAAAARDVAGRPTEIAVVFDVTNSMNFGNSWAAATGTLGYTLERLRGIDSDADLFVSLVPTGDRVNLSGVIDRVQGEHDWLTGTMPDTSWEGCVEPRPVRIDGVDLDGDARTFPDALDDAPPSRRGFLATIRDNLPARHIGTRAYGGGGSPPSCPDDPLLAPTRDIAAMETALRALRNEGTGRFDVGLAWGWRLLSPRWQGEWGIERYPSAYGERAKIVLFFTDGHTTGYDREVLPEDGGFQRSYGHNNGTPNGFEHLVDLCRRMKDAGIRIVMLQIDGNDHFGKYARACASSAQDYFLIDESTSITTALEDIGRGAGSVRLVR